jgi:hypothetical protein
MITESQTFTTGPYTINKAWMRQSALLDSKEYCSLRRDVAATIGRDVGEQICLLPVNDGRSGVFTIHEFHDDDAAIRIGKAGRDRLDVSPGASVTALPIATQPSLTRMSAFEQNDVTETVWDDGDQDTLLVCAPHDGMESNTGLAAGIVRKRLGSERASAWFCHAYGPDAFQRHHITSTDMSPSSYPGLARVSDRGFDYCVTFHVWDGDEVLVGGLADAELRESLGGRLAEAIDGERNVVTDYSEMKYAGNSQANLVNWLTADEQSGIQIELTPVVARQYRKRVARAVADWLDDVLSETA